MLCIEEHLQRVSGDPSTSDRFLIDGHVVVVTSVSKNSIEHPRNIVWITACMNISHLVYDTHPLLEKKKKKKKIMVSSIHVHS